VRALGPFRLLLIMAPTLALTCALAGTLFGAPARAQTLTPPPATHATPHKPAPKKPVAKAKPAGKTVTKTVTKTTTRTVTKTAVKIAPVVAPRRAGPPRHPVHGATLHTAIVAAPVAPPKPVIAAAKPAAKPALPAKPPLPADEGPVTHLHIPRYVSLKTDDVNMRKGPGTRYPVDWIYKRRELPVKVEREFDIWRLVEDSDGVKGWMQQNTLVGRRSFVITGADPRTLRAEADSNSAAVAMLKPGVVGRIHSCDAGAAWCQVQVGGYRGWLQRSDFWGTDAGEAVVP
jgi:SH3-like domain-containing protein